MEKVRSGLWEKLSIGLGISHPEMKMDHVAVTPFPALEGAAMLDNSEEKKGSEIMPPTDEKVEFSKLQEEFSKLKEDAEKRQAEFAKIQEKLVQMEKEREELADKVQFVADEKIIEAFTQGPRIKTTQAMRDIELQLFHSLNPEQRELFTKIKAAQPVLVDTNIYNTQHFSKPGEETDEKAQAKVKRMTGKA